MGLPANGYDDLIATCGNPFGADIGGDEARWSSRILSLIRLPFEIKFAGQPVQRMRVHTLALPYFAAVFQAIATAGLQAKVQEFNGCYAWRTKRTDRLKASVHLWAIAVDFNASTNGLGSDPGTWTQDAAVVQIFKDNGFTWGGDFDGTKDPMHFQLCSGY